MKSRQIETGGGPERGALWLPAVVSLAVGAAFFGLWFWLLPSWLGFHVDMAGTARWHWTAAVPSVLGFAVALRCVWDSTPSGLPCDNLTDKIDGFEKA